VTELEIEAVEYLIEHGEGDYAGALAGYAPQLCAEIRALRAKLAAAEAGRADLCLGRDGWLKEYERLFARYNQLFDKLLATEATADSARTRLAHTEAIADAARRYREAERREVEVIRGCDIERWHQPPGYDDVEGAPTPCERRGCADAMQAAWDAGQALDAAVAAFAATGESRGGQ